MRTQCVLQKVHLEEAGHLRQTVLHSKRSIHRWTVSSSGLCVKRGDCGPGESLTQDDSLNEYSIYIYIDIDIRRLSQTCGFHCGFSDTSLLRHVAPLRNATHRGRPWPRVTGGLPQEIWTSRKIANPGVGRLGIRMDLEWTSIWKVELSETVKQENRTFQWTCQFTFGEHMF